MDDFNKIRQCFDKEMISCVNLQRRKAAGASIANITVRMAGKSKVVFGSPPFVLQENLRTLHPPRGVPPTLGTPGLRFNLGVIDFEIRNG